MPPKPRAKPAAKPVSKADQRQLVRLRAQFQRIIGLDTPAAMLDAVATLNAGASPRRRARGDGGDGDGDGNGSDGTLGGIAPSAAVVTAHQSATAAARAEQVYLQAMARYGFPGGPVAGRAKFTESVRQLAQLCYAHRGSSTGRLTHVYGDVEVWTTPVPSLRTPDSFEHAAEVQESGAVPALRLFVGACIWCLFPPESRYTGHDLRTDLINIVQSPRTLVQLNEELPGNARLRSLCDTLAVLLHLLHSACGAGWDASTTVRTVAMQFCDLAERHHVRSHTAPNFALEEQHAQSQEKLGLLSGYGSRQHARSPPARAMTRPTVAY